MTEEPVRRYLDHAIANGAPLFSGALLTMEGRIKVGPWLSFDACQEFLHAAVRWRAESETEIVAGDAGHFGTPRHAPFFDATILSIEPIR